MLDSDRRVYILVKMLKEIIDIGKMLIIKFHPLRDIVKYNNIPTKFVP